jgi:hypothetical protein
MKEAAMAEQYSKKQVPFITVIWPGDNELNRRDVAKMEKLWNSTALCMKDSEERLCAEGLYAGR